MTPSRYGCTLYEYDPIEFALDFAGMRDLGRHLYTWGCTLSAAHSCTMMDELLSEAEAAGRSWAIVRAHAHLMGERGRHADAQDLYREARRLRRLALNQSMRVVNHD